MAAMDARGALLRNPSSLGNQNISTLSGKSIDSHSEFEHYKNGKMNDIKGMHEQAMPVQFEIYKIGLN